MMASHALPLTFGAALLLGLGFGAGPCNIACLPFLGPVFVAGGGGVRRAWRVVLPFSLGRLTGYSAVGLIAGTAGGLASGWLESPAVRWVLGGATILVALSLLMRRQPRACSTPATVDAQPLRRHERAQALMPGGLFLMGAGMALNPCAPLSTVMLAAAASTSALAGASLGLGFGLGAVVVPAVVFGFGVAHLGSEMNYHLSLWRGHVAGVSAAMLALMGLGTAMGWITP